jgi:hypothetical protein
MGVRVKYDIQPEFVKPKLEDLVIESVTEKDMEPTSTVSAVSSIQAPVTSSSPSAQKTNKDGYSWESWTLSLSLSNMEGLAKTVEDFLKQVDKVTKILVQVIKIMRLFSGNVKSIAMFLKFLIKIVAKQLKELLDSFTSTGFYMSIISPNFDKKFPKYTIPVYGGYREFIQRVNATCTSSTDPDAPKFDDPEDKVGGVILAMLGGVNDPKFLADLVHNFRVLSQFFGFQNPMPTPPNGFKVTAGFYKNPQTSAKAMGVQLSWSPPDTPVTLYKIYKGTSPKGFMRSPSPIQDGKEVKVRLPGEWIADMPNVFSKQSYRYTDFAVESGKTYYYKVYSLVGDDFFDVNPIMEDISSPVATPMLSVSPRNCIPVSELTKYGTFGINGLLQDPFNFEGEWKSVSVRTMLGSTLDVVFKRIDALTDKLVGMVTTGSNAMTDYLNFYTKSIESLLNIVTEMRDIIARLLAFNLRGTFMCLRLPIEKGGMSNFVGRFNQASNLGNTSSGVGQTETLQSILEEERHTGRDSPFEVTQGGGIAQYSEQGIMFGVILLFGFPNPKNLEQRLLEITDPSQVKALKASLESTEKAITTMMKLLGLE